LDGLIEARCTGDIFGRNNEQVGDFSSLVFVFEPVYRVLFSEFDGATDRIPIEALFGLVFAWLAIRFVGDVYRNRKQRSAKA